MVIRQKTGPSAQPVTAAMVRERLMLEADEKSDQELQRYVAAAWGKAEAYTRRRFVSQEVTLVADCFCGSWGDWLLLPISPITSVISVRYRDSENVTQVLSAEDYYLATSSQPPSLMAAPQSSWPTVAAVAGAVEVDLAVGYGETEAAMPPMVVHAVLTLVAQFEANTIVGNNASRDATGLPKVVRDMLDPLVLWL